MKINPDKYVVFKREDLLQILGEVALGPHTRSAVLDERIKDAVVIRKGDQFAASALYAYASAVQTATEIMEAHDVQPEVLDRLRDLADFFAGEADHARQMKSKLPD